jgi:hypothetical protein
MVSCTRAALGRGGLRRPTGGREGWAQRGGEWVIRRRSAHARTASEWRGQGGRRQGDAGRGGGERAGADRGVQRDTAAAPRPALARPVRLRHLAGRPAYLRHLAGRPVYLRHLAGGRSGSAIYPAGRFTSAARRLQPAEPPGRTRRGPRQSDLDWDV